MRDSPQWPFVDAPDRAAFTTVHIIERGAPVLLVTHEIDGDWQFLPGTAVARDDMKVVCLSHLLDRDASVGELADLPRGWQAEREAQDKPWVRSPLPPADAET